MAKKYDSQAMIEKILTTAMALFASKGVSQTSVQDITLRAGISKGAIYHHFKSKDEIFKQVLSRYEEQILGYFEEWKQATNHLNGLEQLRELLLLNLNHSVSRQVNQNLDLITMEPSFKMITIQVSLKGGGAVIADIIRKGITDGSIETEYPDECAEAFLLLLNWWGELSGATIDSTRRLRFIQHLMKSLGLDLLTDEIIQQLLALMEQTESSRLS
ncbi:TetR/AcrR family transcriptional regulator [Streptococcus dentasini]